MLTPLPDGAVFGVGNLAIEMKADLAEYRGGWALFRQRMGNQSDASLNRRLPADTKKFTGHLAGYSTTLIAWESEIGNLDFSCQRWASEAATTDEFIAFYRKVADSRHLVAATGVEGDRCLDNLSHDLLCAQRRCKYDAGFIDGNKIH